MAITETRSKSKSKSGNRYPGVDSQPWVVRTSAGEKFPGSYASFTEANAQAQKSNMVPGEAFAQAVRG